jgi:hypothetical protein
VLKAWDGTAWRSVSITGDFVETTGDTMTGALVMDNQQQVRFREATANGTSYVALQAAASVASNKTITLPDATGTVVLSGAIANADINASAAIAFSKLATGALPSAITIASANIVDGSIVNADINASAGIVDTKLATIATAGKIADSALPATITSSITGNAATATTATNCSRSVVAGNGITGGGALTANQTITLGTPGSVTGSSTNAVTASSHTHAIVDSALVASAAGAVGSYALVKYLVGISRGSTGSGSNLRAAGGNTSGVWYSTSTALTGTWRNMGQPVGANDFGFVQRTA